MELKHHNPSGEIVLTNKSNPFQKKQILIVKIAFKNKFYKLFFQEDA